MFAKQMFSTVSGNSSPNDAFFAQPHNAHKGYKVVENSTVFRNLLGLVRVVRRADSWRVMPAANTGRTAGGGLWNDPRPCCDWLPCIGAGASYHARGRHSL
jgi:hypothetical protein